MKNKTNSQGAPETASTFDRRSLSQSSTKGRERSPLILLVQGDVTVRQTLANQLRQQSCTVLEASTGVEALEIAELKQPDLILLDVRLPDADGFDTICELKDQPTSSRIPIIAMGSPGLRHEKNRCLTAGATAWAFKPASAQELHELIQSHLPLQNGGSKKSF